MTHELKTHKIFFEPQKNGEKMFELRKDDRPYKVGDNFLSQEYDPQTNEYTGRETMYQITYIFRDDAEFFGLKKGYCILQLREIDNY